MKGWKKGVGGGGVKVSRERVKAACGSGWGGGHGNFAAGFHKCTSYMKGDTGS